MLGEIKQIKQMIHDMIRDVHTCIPGKITSYDASSGTAKIQPSGKYKKANGEYLDYPELDKVPVISLQSADQKATIAFPIKEDDGCFIFFAEQQLDTWRDGRTPKSDLRHGLTNAVAVVGLFTDSNETIKDACDDDAIIIDRDKSRIIVKKNTVTVYPNKDDTTHSVEITDTSIDAHCGKSTELSMTDTSVGMKCGSACSLNLSAAKISINAPVIELNGLATMVTSAAFGVNTVLFPVSTVPVPGAIPPLSDIPGVSDAIKNAEEAMK